MKFALTLAFLILWNSAAFASYGGLDPSNLPDICDLSLSAKHYGESAHFSLCESPMMCLQPQRHSLETQYPGLVGGLNEIHELMNGVDHLGSALKKRVQTKLVDLKNRLGRGESTIISSIFRFIHTEIKRGSDEWHPEEMTKEQRAKAEVNWVRSSLWTAIVAAHFEGQEILFNRYFEDLYRSTYNAFMDARGMGRGGYHWNPELDIVVRRRDGTSLWVEVKDWSRDHSNEIQSVDIVRRQCMKMNRARDLIKQNPPRTVLVLKHGDLSAESMLHYLTAGCDEVIFVYPLW